MNRALRAATMGALLLSPVALGACSAGQVTQTATQDRDKSGAMADVGNITLRSVVLEAPPGRQYEAGDDAELSAAIVNIADQPDRLISIEGEGFEGIRALGSGDFQPASDPSGFTPQLNLEIPAGETVFLGGDGPTVLLENLAEERTSAQYVDLTMTFELAGEIEVSAFVDAPLEEVERGEAFDFHGEEGDGSGEQGAEDPREAATGAGSEEVGSEGGEG